MLSRIILLAALAVAVSLPLEAQYSGDSGLTCYLTSAASTNSTNCKAAPANLYSLSVFNTTTTAYFLRLYNLSTGPTCSSATGFVETIPIPPAVAAGGVGGAVRAWSWSQGFSAGLGFCITGGGSSTDNTNAATGLYVVLVYK